MSAEKQNYLCVWFGANKPILIEARARDREAADLILSFLKLLREHHPAFPTTTEPAKAEGSDG
jgi:hypothetical protein